MPRGGIEAICRDYGDAGVLVDLVADDYEGRWRAAQTIGEALRSLPPPGCVDVVVSYENVFVTFDPLTTDHGSIRAAVEGIRHEDVTGPAPRLFEVPVLYGGEAGPQLADVAELCALTPDEVVELHAGHEWVLRFVGSPIGAPMLDGSRLPRSIPRLASPAARLTPGSVGVSGLQSIIYNAPSPGGWQIIGLTPALLFDRDHPPHVAYRAGDRLRFRPINASEWDRWRRPLETVPS